jgi:hypothetical protein
MSVDRLGGNESAPDQRVRSVEIGENHLEQLGALDQRALDAFPFAARQQQRDRVERPEPLAWRVVVDVVGDAVLTQHAPRFAPALIECDRPELAERAHHRGPVRAQTAVALVELVVRRGGRVVAGEEAVGAHVTHRRRCITACDRGGGARGAPPAVRIPRIQYPQPSARRRSSV